MINTTRRRFTCPFCGYIHVFAPKGSSRYKKKVVGFSCPRCHKKPTEDDLKKGRRTAKPKGERRKRVKKKVEETPSIVAPQPEYEEIKWKTRESPPLGGHRNRGYGTRRAGWKPKPPQPVDRTLVEADLVGKNIRLSGPIPGPISNSYSMELELEELEKLKEERIALEGVREKLEKHEKRIVVVVTRLDRAEERIGAVVSQMEKLEPMLQNFATLMSRMNELLEQYRIGKPRLREVLQARKDLREKRKLEEN